MEANLQHEDLLIKLRAKLNEEKIKLWEAPYIQADNGVSQNLQVLNFVIVIVEDTYSNCIRFDYEN